ncbi:major facilitator superfamily domain-containing protein [Aspergillus flavus]|uniref:Major facilitator superfamily domain-containing protein n=3 Tax=Aspergillus subgen. Circumdati TaxID=2720871 RepID=A0A7U2QXQ2_ASPFN|nr:hypothetical protein Ao3042_11852 [Aspergillus oryzae 3.042]KAB8242469.1 major facilitator superfamily domain-containing protein [Aspergillus flavus]KAF7628494.1 hypothetical protein AFLA_003849 [Aspergillus flavus NRRL3357]KDE81708.1 hypothetical protein AO1008_08004 [Aspergillus oryzae 100-8]KAJ1706869.1 hypothetical protein NYO67_10961 [Aspergillus flavus]|eukprot:EIT82975.1 hypothetical protein Ao3042_11852 [Aspergillus oryzae 3.042]
MFRTHVEEQHKAPWGHAWRSSNTFITCTMSLAMFTDELLFAFMIPLLPTVLEHRIGLLPSLTQRYTSIFLAEGAFVSVVSSPFIGAFADAVSSKKTLLLILLVLALVSTACLSLASQLVWLFIGRFFQCITSNALWIVGMSTMAENLGSEHMGKISGLTTTLTATGTTTGPVLAGLLFELGGYWCAWTGAAAFLLLDIIMRLIMIEKRVKPHQGNEDENEDGEQDPLLQNQPPRLEEDGEGSGSEVRGWRFHVRLFRVPRFSAGVFCAFVYAVLVGCFESTLAVHVRAVFGWGALHVGVLLALIQGPGMLLAAPVGWMKDRIGSRAPTAVGLFGLLPFVVLLGVPGSGLFPGMGVQGWEKSLYVGCMASIGCLLSLLNGVGSMQATETIDLLEAHQPGIFGPKGGYSRAIAVTSMTWMTGLLAGPLLAEFVVGNFGYFELQCCLGVLSFTAGLIALVFLGSPVSKSTEQQDVLYQ